MNNDDTAPANNGVFSPTIAILPPLPPSSESSSLPAPQSTESNASSQPNQGMGHTNSNTANPNADPNTINTIHTLPSAPPKSHQPHQLHQPNLLPDPNTSSPRLSSNWDPDFSSPNCTACHSAFDPLFNRRHHCRLCGRVFCHNCSNTRSLIPPSSLVIRASAPGAMGGVGGIGGLGGFGGNGFGNGPSFSPPNDLQGDASVTYVRTPSHSSQHSADLNGGSSHDDDTLLYGRGLEQRMLLARHPQRTCHSCRAQLAPLQEELCLRNSNAMRYNYIDEGDALRKFCNSPLAFTLGHEVRKAAYTLGNLLPGKGGKGGMGSSRSVGGSMGGERMGAFLPTDNEYSSYPPPEADPCHIPNGVASCKTIDPTLKNLDGNLHIPSRLLQRARGVAIVTSAKGGLGFAGFEFGTGLVVARRSSGGGVGNSGNSGGGDTGAGGSAFDLDAWSAPSAIGIAGFAWGALVGAQVSDHVFLLMTDDAVRLFASEDGRQIQLGVDVGVAVGPVGRSAEADIGATTSGAARGVGGGSIAMAPIYTYSLSKGLYAGVSLDGRVVMTRPRVNEKFYGRKVSAYELLSGQVATPPAAQPLYDALKRCRVYAGGGGAGIVNSCLGAGGESVNRAGMDGGSNINSSIANPMMSSSYGVSDSTNFPSGGLMERWSHATGAGMPVMSSTTGRNTGEPYNLSGRANPLPPNSSWS